MICAAPLMRAPWMAPVPMPPTPMTTTVSPVLHLGTVLRGAVAGGDPARQQCHRQQRQVGIDLDDRIRGNHSVFRERTDLRQMPEVSAVGGVMAEGAVRRHSGNHHLRAHVADVLHAGVAPPALAADRDERRHDVVAWRELGDAFADFEHHPGAFVAADHREHRGQAVRLASPRWGQTCRRCGCARRSGTARRRPSRPGPRRPSAGRARSPRPTTADPCRAGSPRGFSCDRPERHRQVLGRAERHTDDLGVVVVPRSCRSVTRSKRLFSIAFVSTRARCMPRQLWIPPAKEMCARRGRWMSNTPGIGPPRFVAIGRTHAQVDLGALRDRHAVHLDVAGGVARPPGPTGFRTESLPRSRPE